MNNAIERKREKSKLLSELNKILIEIVVGLSLPVPAYLKLCHIKYLLEEIKSNISKEKMEMSEALHYKNDDSSSPKL